MIDRRLRYHFSGLAGAGMNPLAQLMAARGHVVQGSDRSFDKGKNADLAARLATLGIVVRPQDGEAVTADLDRFVYSTAVEVDTPEFRAARALGLELVPRPALLAEIVNAGRPGVAIAGTSGKSTITGMLAWLARESGLAATVLGGAALAGEGVSGCFRAGPSDGPVAAESCESDGTLTGYHPVIGVIHNISRDHGEVDTLRSQFEAFARQSGRLFVNATSPEAAGLGKAVGAFTYGTVPSADARLEVVSVGPHRATGALRLDRGSSPSFSLTGSARPDSSARSSRRCSRGSSALRTGSAMRRSTMRAEPSPGTCRAGCSPRISRASSAVATPPTTQPWSTGSYSLSRPATPCS